MARGRGAVLVLLLASALGWASSPASAAKAAPTVPGAPTVTSVAAGNRSVAVAFTAPASNGGAAILRYRVTCVPFDVGENKSGNARKSPILVKSLRAGRSYSCTVAAYNRVGVGAASTPFRAPATPGTTCTDGSGTATFTPPLPKFGNKTLVDSVLTLNGTIIGCIGGGVTSGTIAAVSQPTPLNCTIIATFRPAPILATLTIAWNTGASSTIVLHIDSVKGNLLRSRQTGTVTSGLFVGRRLTGLSDYKISKGGCSPFDLATLTYRHLLAWEIL